MDWNASRLETSMGEISRSDLDAFFKEMESLRPQLHRYCARFLGSAFDGEDLVQDVYANAVAAVGALNRLPDLKPWIFRIAHNRAVDILRARKHRVTESIEVADHIADDGMPNPEEAMMNSETVKLAVSSFAELPVSQRSAVILKDVLGHSLEEIASLLDVTVNSVKALLARGRSRLQELGTQPISFTRSTPASPQMLRFTEMFNNRDWDGLRGQLAADVKLNQSHMHCQSGARNVGSTFFVGYEKAGDWRLESIEMEGRDVVAVYGSDQAERPAYVMILTWSDGLISDIRDFRYAHYFAENVDFGI